MAFTNHFLEQITQERRIEAAGEFIDHRCIAGHRLGDHDVCPPNARPFGAATPRSFHARCARSQSAKAAICAQRGSMSTPWRLCSTMSAVHAAQIDELRVIFSQRPACRLALWSASAQPSKPPRRSPAADRSRRAGSALSRRRDRGCADLSGSFLGRGCTVSSAERTRYSHTSRASVVFTVHLQPHAAERVIGEELHDVSWREELVADRQFATVARCLALLAHLPALFPAVEELVDPADRLVLAPHALQSAALSMREQRLERLPLRPQHRRRHRAGRTAPSSRSKTRRTCSRYRADIRRIREQRSPGAMPQNSL